LGERITFPPVKGGIMEDYIPCKRMKSKGMQNIKVCEFRKCQMWCSEYIKYKGEVREMKKTELKINNETLNYMRHEIRNSTLNIRASIRAVVEKLKGKERDKALSCLFNICIEVGKIEATIDVLDGFNDA
jgi:hypothetical protein